VADGVVPPETRYARLGPDRLAYQVLGPGPPRRGVHHGQLRPRRPGLGRPAGGVVPAPAGVVLAAAALRPARDRASDPPPAEPLPAWEAYTEELERFRRWSARLQWAIGTRIRAGLHIGEVELRGDDVGGIAGNIAARIMATAGPGEIVVSRTVRDLVGGSDVVLQDRGSRRLKGVEGDWQLFGVVGR
jgi:hypothetical protein